MEYPNETSLKEVFRTLKRAAIPALVAALILGGATYYLRSLSPDLYLTTSTLVLSQSAAPTSVLGITLLTSSMIDVRAYRTAIESPAMLNAVLEALGDDDPTGRKRRNLLSQLSVGIEQAPSSSLINIDVYSDTAEGSARIATAVNAALIDWDQQRAVRSLDSIVETLESQIQAQADQIRVSQANGLDAARINALITAQNELTQQRDAARALRTSAVGRLEVLSPPIPPEEPLSTNRTMFTLLAAMIGALGVIAVYLIRNAFDRRMRSSDEFYGITGVPVLAEFTIPRKPSQLISLEEANYLGAGITYGKNAYESKVILVASVERGEGSASVAFGLAASIANNAQNVLLVDADMRNPVSTKAFDLPFSGMDGLDEYLANPGVSLAPIDHRIKGSPNLHVVPTHRPVSNASALLVRGFRPRIEEWAAMFDVVVVHAPPLLAVADGLIIAPHSNGAVMVCNLRVTSRNRIRRALQLLERLDVRILGAATTGDHDERESSSGAIVRATKARPEHRMQASAARRR